VAEAEEERFRLVSREEVVRSAQAEAERVLEEAREMARQIRLEAEDYVDAKLAQFEIALERTYAELERSIAQVRRGRDKLRGVSVAEEEFGPGEQDEES
jgi:cell division septum initiation protein DivIVA